MSDGQYISVRETAQILGITQKKVMDLIESRELQAYRIAGQFLRLNRTEVLNLRNSGSVATEIEQLPYTSSEKIRDFFYFNDFYLASLTIIIALILFIFYA